MKAIFFLLLHFLWLCLSCGVQAPMEPAKKDSVITPIIPAIIPTYVFDLSLLDRTALFAELTSSTKMVKQDYDEISGMAESISYTGIIYLHEDKPGKNFIIISNKNGEDLGKIYVDGASPADWEDMTYGPGPDPALMYIYVADIGDNNAKNSSATVYRFPEPSINLFSASTEIHVKEFDKIKFTYSRGATNAETILLDPLTKDLYILTKENSKSFLYQIPYPQSSTTTSALKPLAQLGLDFLTSGAISADGMDILLRNKSQIWYWKRDKTESVLQALAKKPQDAPYAGNEHQGEAISFSYNAPGFMTISEIRDYPGDIAKISFYKRK